MQYFLIKHCIQLVHTLSADVTDTSLNFFTEFSLPKTMEFSSVLSYPVVMTVKVQIKVMHPIHFH